MHRLILLFGWLLVGCAPQPSVTGFRDPARPIYSSAVLDPARLTGKWAQIGDFAAQPGCRAPGVVFSPAASGLVVDGQLCLAGRLTAISGPVIPAGPGRFSVAGLETLWVLWADTDVRSLVIGTPSGRFGLILNRQETLPPDRLIAARDVLSWNGYDLDRLQISR